MQNVANSLRSRNRAPWDMAGYDVSGCETVADALERAGMDWTVSLSPVRCTDGNGGSYPVDGHFLTVRDDKPADDPSRVLGCVKGRYNALSNAETLGIADAVRAQGNIGYERAGTIRNGRTAYIVAKMPGAARVLDDSVAQYLIIRTSHDGSSAVEVIFTPYRLACSNQLSGIFANTDSHITIRHTANAGEQLKQAEGILAGARDYFGAAVRTFTSMAQASIDRRFVDAYLNALIPDPKGANANRAKKQRSEIQWLFNGGQAAAYQDACRGTAYGLFNAVTEYADHHRTVRAGKRNPAEARMDSSVFGSGARFRERAFGLLKRATVGNDGKITLVQEAHTQATDRVLDGIQTGAPTPADTLLDGIDWDGGAS